jgi:2-dehydro-3-deoxyphosphooctonate aldolase (KDO 8-P synthase)
METHVNPNKALSDGPNSLPLHQMKNLLKVLKEIDRDVKKEKFLENV